MITIIQNLSLPNGIIINRLKNKFQKALEFLNIPDLEVTIVLDSNKKLRELKKLYLDIDESTDVLSFKMGENNPETGVYYLGDVVISLEKAIIQASEKKIPVELEVVTLFVHGLLHLLNYGHSNDIDAEKMQKKQSLVLNFIGRL